jgi:hypothetical protein
MMAVAQHPERPAEPQSPMGPVLRQVLGSVGV